MADRFDHHEIKERLAFLDLVAHEGIAMRRSGPHFVGRCPFHEERSGSFTVHGPKHDHGHCYGCGWNGDIFDFWRERHGSDFGEACASLASLARVSPAEFNAKRSEAARMTRATRLSGDVVEKPALPRLRALTGGEIEQLAALRKLDVAGVAAAASDKRVGACDWPQFQDRQTCWRLADDASASWVVTDGARCVAQFRRLNGEKYVLKKEGQASEIKAWTKGSPRWPLGAAEIGDRGCVMLVEGGADMLAAYHFLSLFRRLDKVAVVGILGSSNTIFPSALPFFRRKRVRIFMDEDEWKVIKLQGGKERRFKPGAEAAARWTSQLVAAGAAVETFSLAGLTQKTGEPVKDLNDLAVVEEGAWVEKELREAFFDFDF